MVDGNASSNNSGIDPLIGVVFGRYKIAKFIEKGGWGVLYKATDLTLHKDVVIKIIHRHFLHDESNLKRFQREAGVLCRLESKYVMKVLDADTNPAPYIAMESFEGTPLNDWIAANGAMNAQMAIDLFRQLLCALTDARALNIVHRDLKPASILVRIEGSNIEAKIVDFGFARCLTPDSTFGGKITAPGETLGNPAYMSLEHFRGNCDQRSDIYSLGCIMYELLAGRPPFRAKYALEYFEKHQSAIPEPILKVNSNSNLPPGLEEIILACLQKSPNRRYQSAELCAADLNGIGAGLEP